MKFHAAQCQKSARQILYIRFCAGDCSSLLNFTAHLKFSSALYDDGAFALFAAKDIPSRSQNTRCRFVKDTPPSLRKDSSCRAALFKTAVKAAKSLKF